MKELLIIVALKAVLITAYYPSDTPIVPVPSSCPPSDSEDSTVHLRHETDCTKFYKCLAGEKFLLDCPWANKAKTYRLHFNPVLQVCDFPNRAGCRNTIISDETWNSSWTCLNRPAGTKLPHESRCYLYYECSANGNGLPIECADGETFNPYQQRCDNLSKCPLSNPCKNHRDEAGKFYPDPNNCKNAYYCKGQTETIYPCDENAGWDKVYEKCVPMSEANCY